MSLTDWILLPFAAVLAGLFLWGLSANHPGIPK